MQQLSFLKISRFPEFGKEVRRRYERHEWCYDCRRFYGECKGRRVDKETRGKKLVCEKAKWFKRINVG